MKKFNKNKSLKQIKIKQNKNTYIKGLSIFLSCLILLFIIMLFTFAKFETSSDQYTLINGVVKIDNSYRISGNASDILSAFNEYSSSSSLIDKGQDKDKSCTNTFIYDQTSDNNLRYIGKNPCNYVLYNGELWRIVGIMNNKYISESDYTNKTNGQSLIKIIRNSSLGDYSWDTSASSVNSGGGSNQWGASKYKNNTTYEGSDIMRELNTDYLGNITIGIDGKWYNGKNNTKSANKPSSTISSSAQNYIQSIVWNLGTNGDYLDVSYWTSKNMYNYEKSTNTGITCTDTTQAICNSNSDNIVRTSSWYGKVGLIYPSDYGYATSKYSECLDISLNRLNNSSYSICNDNNWMYSATNKWLILPRGGHSLGNITFGFRSNGNIGGNELYEVKEIYPTLYLKSSVSIDSGNGSYDVPYNLE